MTLNFNLQGAERKTLVQAISAILETPAVYLRTPTYAYQVGEYHIDKNGTVTGEDNTDLVNLLQQNGFIAENAAYEASTEANEAEANALETTATEAETGAEEDPAEADEAEADTLETEATEGECGVEEASVEASEPTIKQDGGSFTIEMPLTGFDPAKLDNLCRMVASKETLLKAALDTEALPIQQSEDRLSFPWWNRMLTSEEVEAYSTLISLLCKTAKEKTRVTAKGGGLPVNPKYAMRCYLLSLGFIGEEYKNSRRIILAKLEGNGSWKNGKPEAETEPSAPDTADNAAAEALADETPSNTPPEKEAPSVA